VLLVEDQPADAKVVGAELRVAGIEAGCECVATEAEYVAALYHAPDVILCDYHAENFGAVRALGIHRERNIDIPLIIVSGNINEEEAVAALKLGAADYLFKDRLGRLGEAVRQAVAARRLRDEKRKAEAALRASEERHRQLVELSPDAIVVIAGEEIVFVNRAALRLLRTFSPQDLVGRSFLEFVHPSCRHRILWDLNRVSGDNAALPLIEERMVRLDGTLLDVELTAAPVTHQDREAMQLFIRDVTERKRAEEARHESELQLHIALNSARLATWSWDLPTDRVTWSEGIEALFGFPPGSFNQSISSYLNCVHPADRDWVEQNLAEAKESECSFEVEHRVRWPDGGTRWIYLKGNSASDDSGHVQRLSGVVMDITERKRTEVEIQKMAAFARYNPNPVFEFSAQGKLTYSNDAAQEMAVTLGRKHPADILPPQVAQLVGECLATEEKRTFTGTTVGGRTVSWSFFPILPHQVVHCYARDITERISLEEQLRQAQKMEAIGQLAGGVAHDFNNILTIIQGHVSLLATDPALPADARENLDEVLGAAERAANLTRQLLTFSRKQVIQLQHLDINDVVNRLARMLRRVIGEDVTFHFEQSPEPLAVNADAGMIEQAIMNLAVNARDAMPGGGTLSITTAAASITDVHLHDEGGRQRHRPRPGLRLWHRQATPRLDRGGQPGRRRHHVPAFPAVPVETHRRAQRRGWWRGGPGKHADRHRDRALRRGRTGAPADGLRRPQTPRLPGARGRLRPRCAPRLGATCERDRPAADRHGDARRHDRPRTCGPPQARKTDAESSLHERLQPGDPRQRSPSRGRPEFSSETIFPRANRPRRPRLPRRRKNGVTKKTRAAPLPSGPTASSKIMSRSGEWMLLSLTLALSRWEREMPSARCENSCTPVPNSGHDVSGCGKWSSLSQRERAGVRESGCRLR
jgi:PAS domain S-box-containing protein